MPELLPIFHKGHSSSSSRWLLFRAQLCYIRATLVSRHSGRTMVLVDHRCLLFAALDTASTFSARLPVPFLCVSPSLRCQESVVLVKPLFLSQVPAGESFPCIGTGSAPPFFLRQIVSQITDVIYTASVCQPMILVCRTEVNKVHGHGDT